MTSSRQRTVAAVREPAAVKRRPHYKGLPVPFTAFIDPAGVPDFKVLHQENSRRCITERLCGICGEQIGRFACFIGGPKSMQSGQFIDSAMHEVCSRYAFSVCPFLAGRTAYAEHLKDHGEGVNVVDALGEQSKRPDRMALYVTESFHALMHGGQTVIQAGPPHRISWLN